MKNYENNVFAEPYYNYSKMGWDNTIQWAKTGDAKYSLKLSRLIFDYTSSREI